MIGLPAIVVSALALWVWYARHVNLAAALFIFAAAVHPPLALSLIPALRVGRRCGAAVPRIASASRGRHGRNRRDPVVGDARHVTHRHVQCAGTVDRCASGRVLRVGGIVAVLAVFETLRNPRSRSRRRPGFGTRIGSRGVGVSELSRGCNTSPRVCPPVVARRTRRRGAGPAATDDRDAARRAGVDCVGAGAAGRCGRALARPRSQRRRRIQHARSSRRSTRCGRRQPSSPRIRRTRCSPPSGAPVSGSVVPDCTCWIPRPSERRRVVNSGGRCLRAWRDGSHRAASGWRR